MKQIKYIFLLSIIFFACDEINPVNDISNDYNFLCVIKNDQAIQKAYLYKSINIEETLISNATFIHDAEIIVSNGTIFSQLQVREFQVHYSTLLEYTYSDDSFFQGKILPNTRYDVQIKINNEIVTGSTTTPGEFTINRPSNDTLYLYQGVYDYYYIPVSWNKSTNSFQYLVYSIITYKSNDGKEMEDSWFGNTADTSTTVSFQRMSISQEGIQYHAYQVKFIVYAIDKNYYDHAFLSRDRAGLSAQYGVFGSTIVDSCIVDIIR